MSIELQKEANPVPPDRPREACSEEHAQRLLASILAEEPSRSRFERLRSLAPPRLVRTVGVAVALALVALVFSVTLPFGDGSGGGGKIQLGILGRAAAALPDRGQVVHVVWLQPDFASDSPAMTLKYQEWFDRPSKTDDLIISKGHKSLDGWTISGKGYVASNTLIDPKTEPFLYGSIAGAPYASLIEDYRKALESGKVVLIGSGRAFGKPVYWVRLRCPKSGLALEQQFRCAQRLALDKRTYLPVVSEMHAYKKIQLWNGDHTTWAWYETDRQSEDLMTTNTGVPFRYRILKVELIPRDQANINPPGSLFKH